MLTDEFDSQHCLDCRCPDCKAERYVDYLFVILEQPQAVPIGMMRFTLAEQEHRECTA